ncbi:MAG TPA: SDR family NAD(P)-dependent oxidoreductase [Bacteriovoracaceae bacterium]|nr:SDR family NAD(P)-dependent oxidoreductase [Bacteriovoracaceae bacterium]
MQSYFAGKRILITGAASGIGRDLAIVLKGWDAKLALVDIRPVPADVSSGGKEVLTFEADVTNPQPFLDIREKLLGKWGGIDIIIAAAGVGGINPATCFSVPLDHRIMSINYFGTINTMTPFIESMTKSRSGQLVGISSLAAFRGLPQAASYSASKAAQMTLLESMRLDLKKTGISVTCIHPGFVATPMADHDEFQMPFKVSPRKSSMLILKAIAKKKSQYSYPWQMAWLSKLNRLFPNCVYDFLMPRLSPSKATAPKLFSAP